MTGHLANRNLLTKGDSVSPRPALKRSVDCLWAESDRMHIRYRRKADCALIAINFRLVGKSGHWIPELGNNLRSSATTACESTWKIMVQLWSSNSSSVL